MLVKESDITDADSRAITEHVFGIQNGPYTDHYQAPYNQDHRSELENAVDTLISMEGVTNPRQIDALSQKLAAIALGQLVEPIIIGGRCAEPVGRPVGELMQEAVDLRDLIRDIPGLQNAVVIERNRGQTKKPRTTPVQKLPDGRVVTQYMGDGINGQHVDDRTPDPSRLVSAAVQAQNLEAAITNAVGEHVPAAHELLSLAYDRSFIRKDQESGKQYLVSADLPWAGVRTNKLTLSDGQPNPHLEILSKIENPVAVKIGADSTPEHIAGLKQKLNPNSQPGKLVFMLRPGPDNEDSLRATAKAINKYAPESIILYDIHGVTKTGPNGEKIRAVSDIVDDISQTARICREEGLKLHGVHLETIGDDSRLECVDTPDQLPTHPGGVDPQLNPRQTRAVLNRVLPYLI